MASDRIVDADDELRVVLVVKTDGDRLLRVVDVPKRPLTVIDKASRGDNAGQVGADHP